MRDFKQLASSYEHHLTLSVLKPLLYGGLSMRYQLAMNRALPDCAKMSLQLQYSKATRNMPGFRFVITGWAV